MAESRSLNFKEFEDILECMLCLERGQNPRTLPCQHWYCAKCIKKLIEKSKWPSRFFCPACRTEVQNPPGGAESFPPAFMIKKLDEAVLRKKEAHPKRKSKCQKHGEELVLFCERCKKMICARCAKEHKGHDMISPEEMIENQRKPTIKTIKQMETRLEDLKVIVQKVTTAKSERKQDGDTTKQQLRDHGDQVIKKVNADVAMMQKQIDQEISKQITDLELSETQLKSQISHLTESIQMLKDSLSAEEATRVDLKFCKELLRTLDTKVTVPKATYDLDLSNLNALTTELLVGTLKVKTQPATMAMVSMVKEVAPPRSLNIRQLHKFQLQYQPLGAACSADGTIAVCGNDSKVHIHTRQGQQVSTLSPGGMPWGIATTSDMMYVTEQNTDNTDNGRLFLYKQGALKSTVTVGYKGEGGLAISDNNIFITSSAEHKVYKLDLDCSNQQVFVKHDLKEPLFIATNNHHVAISCIGSHKVHVYDNNGTRPYVYGGEGKGPGHLRNPHGVVLDSRGRLLIADYSNHRVSIVSPQGHHLGDIKLDQEGLYTPRGLALTPTGEVVVTCGISYFSDSNAIAIYNY